MALIVALTSYRSDGCQISYLENRQSEKDRRERSGYRRQPAADTSVLTRAVSAVSIAARASTSMVC